MLRGFSLCLLLFPVYSVWGVEQSYTYVKMSLGVPWTLYFVFLAGVLIPFAVIIFLAWRGPSARDDRHADADK